MRYKIYYGASPTFTDADKRDFSRGGYKCKALMKDRRNRPVVISQSKDSDLPVWKVEYGFSCVLFGTQYEAMAFCRARFTR